MEPEKTSSDDEYELAEPGSSWERAQLPKGPPIEEIPLADSADAAAARPIPNPRDIYRPRPTEEVELFDLREEQETVSPPVPSLEVLRRFSHENGSEDGVRNLGFQDALERFDAGNRLLDQLEAARSTTGDSAYCRLSALLEQYEGAAEALAMAQRFGQRILRRPEAAMRVFVEDFCSRLGGRFLDGSVTVDVLDQSRLTAVRGSKVLPKPEDRRPGTNAGGDVSGAREHMETQAPRKAVVIRTQAQKDEARKMNRARLGLKPEQEEAGQGAGHSPAGEASTNDAELDYAEEIRQGDLRERLERYSRCEPTPAHVVFQDLVPLSGSLAASGTDPKTALQGPLYDAVDAIVDWARKEAGILEGENKPPSPAAFLLDPRASRERAQLFKSSLAQEPAFNEETYEALRHCVLQLAERLRESDEMFKELPSDLRDRIMRRAAARLMHSSGGISLAAARAGMETERALQRDADQMKNNPLPDKRL